MAKSYHLRLEHILQSIADIEAIAAGRDLTEIQEDRVLMLAFERSFEIISEASRHLPDDLKERNSEIPWRQVAGIGNVLRHEYDDIAPRLLWRTVKERLPALKQVCKLELKRFRAVR